MIPPNLKINPLGLEMQCLSKQQLTSKPRTVSLLTLCQSPSTTGLGCWDSLDWVKWREISLVYVPALLMDPLLETLQIISIGTTPNKDSRAFLPGSRHFKGVGACINCVFTVSCEITYASLLLQAINVKKHNTFNYLREMFWRGESLKLVKCISVTMKKRNFSAKALCQD